jgi:hypothetical protein
LALIKDSQVTRFIPPHEPESWFDVRALRTGDLEVLEAEGSQVKMTRESLATVIQAWSYEDPVTLENVNLLDLETFLWLCEAALDFSKIRSAVEKKGSTSGLSAQRPPAPADSPKSSPTSEKSSGSRRRGS